MKQVFLHSSFYRLGIRSAEQLSNLILYMRKLSLIEIFALCSRLCQCFAQTTSTFFCAIFLCLLVLRCFFAASGHYTFSAWTIWKQEVPGIYTTYPVPVVTKVWKPQLLGLTQPTLYSWAPSRLRMQLPSAELCLCLPSALVSSLLYPALAFPCWLPLGVLSQKVIWTRILISGCVSGEPNSRRNSFPTVSQDRLHLEHESEI